MADNAEALDLKRRARRRLTGAIALVLALVLVPPWLMDLEPRPVQTDLTVHIPPQDGARLKPPAPPAAKPTPQPVDAAVEAQPERAQPAAREGVQKADTASRPAAAPDADRDRAADAKRAEAILAGGPYVIPLGAFANKENVASLENKLAKAGVKHYTERVTGAGGEQTRVRAGPYATRDAAEKAREELVALGLAPGKVIAKQ
jgi:DedD protein